MMHVQSVTVALAFSRHSLWDQLTAVWTHSRCGKSIANVRTALHGATVDAPAVTWCRVTSWFTRCRRRPQQQLSLKTLLYCAINTKSRSIETVSISHCWPVLQAVICILLLTVCVKRKEKCVVVKWRYCNMMFCLIYSVSTRRYSWKLSSS